MQPSRDESHYEFIAIDQGHGDCILLGEYTQSLEVFCELLNGFAELRITDRLRRISPGCRSRQQDSRILRLV